MAKNKEEASKKAQTKETGYTPFSKDDIHVGDQLNEKAEQLFLEMLDVPKRAAKKQKKGKEVEDEDFYPTSIDETLKMENLLKQVEEAIGDRSDEEFIGYVNWMHDVLNWSQKRHWQFAWWIVICVFLVSIFFVIQAKNKKYDLLVTTNWTEQEIKSEQKESIASFEKNIGYYQEKIATDTLSNETKTSDEESLEKARIELQSVQKMSTKDFHEQKIKEATKEHKNKRASAVWCFLWIGLYMLALRPYGYMVSKRRAETKVYSGMKYFLFNIAGALLGAATSMKVSTYITKWRDGSTTKDNDAIGVLAIQLVLLLLAVVLVLFIARIVIVVAAISGFIRNYDLTDMAKKLFAKNEQTAQTSPKAN